jgi:ankyrin repeat protein
VLRVTGCRSQFEEPTAANVATNHRVVLQALNDGLLKAVESKQIENVKILLEIKANPETTDDAGYSALMWATHVKSPECIDCLLKYKADINAKTLWGWTALMDAAQQGNEEILSSLLDARALVNQRVVVFGRSALLEAALVDCPGNIRRLIDSGAVHVVDNKGDSALILAASSGLLDNVKVLAKHVGSSVLNRRMIVCGILAHLHRTLPNCISNLICHMAIPPCEVGVYNNSGLNALSVAHANLHHHVVSYLQQLMGSVPRWA